MILKNVLNFSAVVVLALFTGLTSCDKTELAQEDYHNYSDDVIFAMHQNANCGKFGCYEFVFPVTIQFPEGETQEVDSYEALKSAIRTWKVANPDVDERPALGFPLQVITEDGEVLTVSSQEELMELRQACRRSFYDRMGPNRHRGHGHFCFRIVFPLTLEFPDGTIAEVENPRDLHATLHEWKRNNPDATERPEIVFPITVKLEDGTETIVESREDLAELKASCRGDE